MDENTKITSGEQVAAPQSLPENAPADLQAEVAPSPETETTEAPTPPKKPGLGSAMLSLISVVLVSAFPVLFLYLNNAGEVPAQELWAPLGLFLAIGMGVFLVTLLLLRSMPKAALVTAICVLVFQNYALIESVMQRVFSRLKLWHILPVLLVLCILLGVVVYKKMKPADAGKITLVLSVVFAGLILFNTVTAIPTLAALAAQNPVETQPAGQNGTPGQDGPMPNVYWMIFDEYSSFETMQKYYDYDNSAFGALLEEAGFTVNYNCRNESVASATIIGNYVNLEYVVNDSMTQLEKDRYWMNPPALQMAQEQGYEIIPIALATRFGFKSVVGLTGAGAGATVEGTSFKDLLLNNTFLKDFKSNITNAEINSVTDSIAFLQTPANFPASSGFAFSYMTAPHQPFYFDQDGNLNNPGNFHNWVDKQYYLGYYIYITNQIADIVTSITQNDPNSVIIIQSDHSARYLTDAEGTPLIDEADKKHAFFAAYYRGEPLDEIEGESGVNSLRIVFSKLYGVDMPLVEVPGQ